MRIHPLLILLLLCCSASFTLIAQQLPYYTQFRNYQSIINPGSVSSDYFLYEYNISLLANYRAQWISQAETPRTAFLSGEFISNIGGAFNLLGGVMTFRDQTGPFGMTGYYGRLGSVFSGDPYFGGFSLGISAGLAEYRISADRIIWRDPNDPRIPEFNIRKTRPDIGVGAFFYKRMEDGPFIDDNIYFGISVPQVLGIETEIPNANRTVRIKRVPHYFGTFGWYHFINQDGFLEISGWIKYIPGLRANLDLMGRIQPYRNLWAGAGFNLNGIVHLEFGLNLPGFLDKNGSLKIGYAFDYNISAFDVPFGTSHEITLGYLFGAN